MQAHNVHAEDAVGAGGARGREETKAGGACLYEQACAKLLLQRCPFASPPVLGEAEADGEGAGKATADEQIKAGGFPAFHGVKRCACRTLYVQVVGGP